MMRFSFAGLPADVVQDGDECRLYSGPPYTAAELAGEPNVAFLTAAVDSAGGAQYSPNQPAFALVLLDDNGQVYGRSNGYSTSQFADPEDISFYAIANTYTLTAADVAAFLPQVPFTEEGLTVNTLNVSLAAGAITATGTATFGSGFFAFTINFTYVFSLERVTKPVWIPNDPSTPESEAVEAVVVAESQSTSLVGANPLQSLILLILRGTMRRRLEDTINARLAINLDNELDDYSDAAPTVVDVNIDASGVTLHSVVLLPGFCAGQVGGGSGPASNQRTKARGSGRSMLRPDAEIGRLRAIRKGPLVATERGRQLDALFDAHNKELLRILVRSPKIVGTLNEIAKPVLGEKGDIRSMTLSPTSVEQIHEVLKAMSANASNELGETLEAIAASLGQGEVAVKQYLEGKPLPIEVPKQPEKHERRKPK